MSEMPVMPPVAERFIRTTVARRIDETSDSATFLLEVPDRFASELAFQAGQSVTVRVDVDGVDHVRSYSLSGAPSERWPRITVKRVRHGIVSNWLLDRIAAGAELDVGRPAGRFVRQPAEHHVMFAAGSGITPIRSIILETLATTKTTVSLLYVNRDRQGEIFAQQLDRLAADHPERFQLVRHYSASSGRPGKAHVTALPIPPAACCYVCGPAAFIDMVVESLSASGVERERILVERFHVKSDPHGDVRMAAPATTARVVLTVGGDHHHLEVAAGETIVEAARRLEVRVPSSCLDGFCGACTVRLIEGEIEMRDNLGGVTDEQIADGWVLACQAEPRSDRVQLEFH